MFEYYLSGFNNFFKTLSPNPIAAYYNNKRYKPLSEIVYQIEQIEKGSKSFARGFSASSIFSTFISFISKLFNFPNDIKQTFMPEVNNDIFKNNLKHIEDKNIEINLRHQFKDLEQTKKEQNSISEKNSEQYKILKEFTETKEIFTNLQLSMECYNSLNSGSNSDANKLLEDILKKQDIIPDTYKDSEGNIKEINIAKFEKLIKDYNDVVSKYNQKYTEKERVFDEGKINHLRNNLNTVVQNVLKIEKDTSDIEKERNRLEETKKLGEVANFIYSLKHKTYQIRNLVLRQSMVKDFIEDKLKKSISLQESKIKRKSDIIKDLHDLRKIISEKKIAGLNFSLEDDERLKLSAELTVIVKDIKAQDNKQERLSHLLHEQGIARQYKFRNQYKTDIESLSNIMQSKADSYLIEFSLEESKQTIVSIQKRLKRELLNRVKKLTSNYHSNIERELDNYKEDTSSIFKYSGNQFKNINNSSQIANSYQDLIKKEWFNKSLLLKFSTAGLKEVIKKSTKFLEDKDISAEPISNIKNHSSIVKQAIKVLKSRPTN